MADNYLETQMENYRAGRLAPKRRPLRSVAARAANEMRLAFPPMSVLILGADIHAVEALVKTLRNVDCRVAFALGGDNKRPGQRMAEASGARFYARSLDGDDALDAIFDDMARRGESFDIVYDLRDYAPDSAPQGDFLSRMARLLVLAAHPDFDFIDTLQLIEID